METILICRTCKDREEGLDEWEYALLRLTRAEAKRLLSLRELIPLLRKEFEWLGSLYCLEFFNYKTEWGCKFDRLIDHSELDDGGWFVVGADPKLQSKYGTDCGTLRLTNSGVLWEAAPKHGSGRFETEELSWSELATIARGESSFTRLGVTTAEPLTCRECERSMAILDNGVSHHLDCYGDVDHDQDGDHVAVADLDNEDQGLCPNRIDEVAATFVDSGAWGKQQYVGTPKASAEVDPQVCNPMGFTCPSNYPEHYVAKRDVRSFVSYCLHRCWLGTDPRDPNADCYFVRPVTREDVRDLRQIFLEVFSDVLCDLWDGSAGPGDGELDVSSEQRLSIDIPDAKENDQDPGLLGWDVSLGDEEEGICFTLWCADGEDCAVSLDYSAVSDHQQVLAVLREAYATVGQKLPDRLIEALK